MEAKAIAKFQRVSPRKTRLVAKNVQGKAVEEALNILRFTPNKPAGVIYGVLKSAVANAMQQLSA
ncbi:MAG: 50S ribosomal protein L22, partial [Desulfovibrio sp.]|nr:50S ribosomal protein L22 [Desulfovibrio sp.]